MKHYIHHVPGRLRIKNPLFKNNHDQLNEVSDCFENVDGIHTIKTNVLTGSIVFQFDPDFIEPVEILDRLEQCGHIDLKNVTTLDQTMKEGLSAVGEKVSKIVLGKLVEQGLRGTGLGFLAALI